MSICAPHPLSGVAAPSAWPETAPPPSVGPTAAVSPTGCPAVAVFEDGVSVRLVATAGGGEPYVKLSASVGAEPPEDVVTVMSTRAGNAAAGASACTSLADIGV